MRKVRRDEIVDYVTWAEEARAIAHDRVMKVKHARRVHLLPHLTFLFENAETIRWQVQEMMRVERIVRESAIRHELDTYNGLLGDAGELGCTLLVEIPDPDLRDRLLREWLGLLSHLFVELEDGTRVAPTYDPMQVGADRLSSVQYLRFATDGRVPTALVSDFAGHPGRTDLSTETRTALTADLADS